MDSLRTPKGSSGCSRTPCGFAADFLRLSPTIFRDSYDLCGFVEVICWGSIRIIQDSWWMSSELAKGSLRGLLLNMLWFPWGFFQGSVRTLVDFDKDYQGTPAACSNWLMGLMRLMGHTIQAIQCQPHWRHPFHPSHQQHRAWLMGWMGWMGSDVGDGADRVDEITVAVRADVMSV